MFTNDLKEPPREEERAIDLTSSAEKGQIGFFRVNLEVMLDHSFRRLKKEQNKMIDHMVLKLYNVRFFFLLTCYSLLSSA